MTREEFDNYCGSLGATTHVVQWRGASVWKIGGKIFAIYPNQDEAECRLSFKCSDFSYRILIEQPDIIPAPYMARAKWVQVMDDAAMSESELRSYIAEAYEIIKAKLTKAQRAALA